MKRILLTTVSLGVLGLLSPAFGADLPTYSKAPVLATPVYDWSGYYVGVFGGGGYGNHNLNNARRLCEFHGQLFVDGRVGRWRGGL
jgi:outer membrane immunogenic protein